jgi:hypothetical protein
MHPTRQLAADGIWLLTAGAAHLLAIAAWIWWWLPQDVGVDELPPISVTLLRPEEREVPGELLHFRQPTHPRVREQLALPREVLALAPPPPDAALEQSARGGGWGIQPFEGGTLGGFESGGVGGGSAATGIGAGNAQAPAGSFEAYVGGLRQIGLDVVFVIDATGSMGWLIAEVKARVRSLADWIRELVPVTRFGVVAYRDEDDPEFLVRVQPLTLRMARVTRFLDRLEARGGGDVPEGVDAGLAAAIERAGWSEDSKKLIVILGDAPPHPARRESTLAMARAFHRSGGSVTLVDVSFDANPEIAAARLGVRVDELTTLDDRGVLPDFRQIARDGGGDAATLGGDARVVRQLALLIFGQRWAEAVRPLLGDL